MCVFSNLTFICVSRRSEETSRVGTSVTEEPGSLAVGGLEMYQRGEQVTQWFGLVERYGAAVTTHMLDDEHQALGCTC